MTGFREWAGGGGPSTGGVSFQGVIVVTYTPKGGWWYFFN